MHHPASLGSHSRPFIANIADERNLWAGNYFGQEIQCLFWAGKQMCGGPVTFCSFLDRNTAGDIPIRSLTHGGATV